MKYLVKSTEIENVEFTCNRMHKSGYELSHYAIDQFDVHHLIFKKI